MQSIISAQTMRRTGPQLLVMLAVVAIGVSIGRWVLPEDGALPALSAGDAVTIERADHSVAIIETKFAQMDAADARLSRSANEDASTRIVDVKFAQMEAEDAH